MVWDSQGEEGTSHENGNAETWDTKWTHLRAVPSAPATPTSYYTVVIYGDSSLAGAGPLNSSSQ